MKLDKRTTKELIQAVAQAIIAGKDELTELDRAIGDADHGVNLERGFQAVLRNLEEISALPIGASLDRVGRTLVMAVGGASGPLYGTLFMSLGKHLGGEGTPSRERVLDACDQAIQALKARGKSDAGQKTMLDVLIPVVAELHAGGPQALRRASACALSAAQATVPMVAQRGRASFLGERSAGHMDPGARSSQILVTAACTYLEQQG